MVGGPPRSLHPRFENASILTGRLLVDKLNQMFQLLGVLVCHHAGEFTVRSLQMA